MNAQELGSVASVVVPVVSALGWLLKIHTERSNSALELRMRDHLNGSFMRSKEAHARLDSIDGRMEEMCERMERIEDRLT